MKNDGDIIQRTKETLSCIDIRKQRRFYSLYRITERERKDIERKKQEAEYRLLLYNYLCISVTKLYRSIKTNLLINSILIPFEKKENIPLPTLPKNINMGPGLMIKAKKKN